MLEEIEPWKCVESWSHHERPPAFQQESSGLFSGTELFV